MSKVEDGQSISVHYVGKFDDGTEFDSSRSREEPLAFQVGSGNMITGFNDAVVGMTIGEVKNIRLSPAEAYGDIDPGAIHKIPTSQFEDNFVPQQGLSVYGQSETGERMMAIIDSHDEDGVVLNFNHPMAGKALNFEIELVEIT